MNISHLLALCEKATRGPWLYGSKDDGYIVESPEPWRVVALVGPFIEGQGTDEDAVDERNAAYIAALSPNVVIALLRVMEAAKAYRHAQKYGSAQDVATTSIALRDAFRAAEEEMR